MLDLYTKIANGLYRIYIDKTGVERKEARLLCLMMAQISLIYHTGSEYDRESARLYFKSDDFLKHCEVLTLDEVITGRLLTFVKG